MVDNLAENVNVCSHMNSQWISICFLSPPIWLWYMSMVEQATPIFGGSPSQERTDIPNLVVAAATNTNVQYTLRFVLVVTFDLIRWTKIWKFITTKFLLGVRLFSLIPLCYYCALCYGFYFNSWITCTSGHGWKEHLFWAKPFITCIAMFLVLVCWPIH